MPPAARRYPVPLEEVTREIVVVNSRFIAALAPVFTVEQAKTFIQRIRAQYPDASHHVPAYRVGYGESVIDHCSDAGEPSGTAGHPVLAVLRGSGLGDVALVVTRYFGGTKLGTGGLVRAYTDAAKTVVAAARRAEKVLSCTVMLKFPYPFLERIRRLATCSGGQVLDEDFGALVTATLRFAVEDLPHFEASLAELTNGQVKPMPIETSEVLMPMKGKE